MQLKDFRRQLELREAQQLVEGHTLKKEAWFGQEFTASLRAQLVKNPSAIQETPVQFLGQEDPLAKGEATYSSILAWRISWTVESMGSQRVGHN